MVKPGRWGAFLDGVTEVNGRIYVIPNFRRIPGNKGVLLEDFRYVDKDGHLHTARAGLVYDGASRPILDPWADDIIAAATIHDQHCADGRAGTSLWPSSHIHRLFYEGNKCLGVPEWRARIRYLAVYNLGPRFAAVQESSGVGKSAA